MYVYRIKNCNYQLICLIACFGVNQRAQRVLTQTLEKSCKTFYNSTQSQDQTQTAGTEGGVNSIQCTTMLILRHN